MLKFKRRIIRREYPWRWDNMADWVCKKCGYVRDSRCKPKKCPKCEEQNSFEKDEQPKK